MLIFDEKNLLEIIVNEKLIFFEKDLIFILYENFEIDDLKIELLL